VQQAQTVTTFMSFEERSEVVIVMVAETLTSWFGA